MTVSPRCRSVALLGAVFALVSCAKSDSNAGTDTTTTTTTTSTSATTTSTTAPATGSAAGSAASSAASALSYADLAGTWNLVVVPDSGRDTTPTLATLTAGRDSTSWKIAYKNGPTLPLRVSLAGDSVTTVTPPHMSVRGRGLMTTTRTVYRRSGDKLVGQVYAHYATKRADSTRTLRAEGTRAH